MAQTKCLFLTGSFILLLAAGSSRSQNTGVVASSAPTSSSSSSISTSPPRDNGYFNSTSSLTISPSTWDMRLSKELTLRTCNPHGTLLSQRVASASSSSKFVSFRLELRNGTLVFEFTSTPNGGGGGVASQHVASVSVGAGLADNQQYTVRLKMYLGTVYLNVSTLAAPALYSAVVANASFNSGLLRASISSSELRVGDGFKGCLYGGPGVNFKGSNVAASNVYWNYCPLRSTQGCTNTDQNDCYTRPCLNGGTCQDMFQTYECLCPRNFNGTNCEIDLARKFGCDVSPCENNATCTPLTVTPGELPYRCQCPEGWTGVNCETVLNQCEKVPPLCDRGTCTNIVNSYSCNCTGTGFRGRNCSEDIDECVEGQPCGVNGSCFNYPGSYTCDCPLGYGGLLGCQDIDECLSTPCLNNGTCTQGNNNYTCTCPGGFRGRNCEDNIDDCAGVNCPGQFSECRDGVQSYSCVCIAGYQKQSGVCTDINECASDPCQNGATCRDNINNYNCDCVRGYEGINCETDIDDCASNPCLNNATCVDSVDSFTCQCVLGFTSDNCSVNIDDCAVNACSNGATCNDQVNGYTCTCAEGWTGPTCDENIDDCVSNLCENNSTCTDLVAAYNCTCLTGFTGVYCGTNIDDCDPDPCQNGATCIDGVNDYTCSCTADKMGKNCNQVYDACSFEPCKNNATCSTVKPQHNYTCTCVVGFTGVNCQENINDCFNGSCQSFEVCYDGINNFTCGCPFGMEGPLCQDDIDECADNPCLNGGTCTDHLGYYTCSCPSFGTFGKDKYLTGYTGVNCERNVNECLHYPPICKNGGLCQDYNGSYSCFCRGQLPNGLLPTGSNCQILTSYCLASGGNPCENGGVCRNKDSDYQCDCVPGYTGKNCSVNIDECASNPCQYNGTCVDKVNGYTCECIAGITGDNCQTNIDDCVGRPCGLGICDDQINGYVCNCTDSGFFGDNCENNIDDCLSHNCTNNSTCRDGIKEFTCECQAGYTGRSCQIDIQECASSPCQNKGRCLEYSNQTLYTLGDPSFTKFSYSAAAGYLCRCVPGFEGPHCSINIDECETAACENNATCRDGINNFTCECAPGFKDRLCQTEINECEVYKPCQHSSTCVDKVADYDCQCIEFDPTQPSRNYYGGKNCSIRLSGCDQGSQCENGQCIPTLVGAPLRQAYRCLCRPGFTGFYCEISTTMTFSSNGSEVTYSPNNNMRARPSLSFRFRTTLRNAVLAVYSLSSSTFVSVEVVSGRLVVLYRDSASSQHETLDTQEHVNNADWNHLVLNLQNNISLSLLSGACGSERCSQHFSYPRPKPDSSSFTKVSFGKFDSSLLALTLTKSVFFGCLEDVLFDDMVTLYPGQAYGMYSDTQPRCPRSEQCQPNTCNSHGDCMDLWDTFRCICDRPYWGTTCQHKYTAATFSKDGIPCIATFDVSTLTYSDGLNLSMFLRTRQKNSSLIMYLTNETSSTFMTLEMHNGSLASRLQLCGVLAFFLLSPEPIASGSLNFISLTVHEGLFTLKVNESVQVNTTFSNRPSCPLTASRAYFGTLPPRTSAGGGRKRRQVDAVSSLISLNGVLQDVELQGSKLDFEARDGSNSAPYILMLQSDSNVTLGAQSTISVCNTSDPCLNGGNCSDEFFNDFRCSCPDGYLGKDCSQPDFCKDDSCPSNSECRSLQLGFECISVAQFDGQSSSASYNPHLPDGLPAQTISFTMRTRAVYGAIFETRDLNNFIKVRVKDSSLEVNYMLTDSGFSDSLRMHMPINDGRWYEVEVIVDDNNAMRMRVRHNGTLVQEHPPNEPQPLGETVANLTSLVATVSQGAGSIWVGKALGRTPLRTEQAFKGCLKEVRLGGVLLPFISDSQMKGNVDTIARFQMATTRSMREGCQSPDMCFGHQCHRGATCLDTWNDYSCQCPPGFSGQYCTRQISWCAGSLCHNGGTCEEHSRGYSCTCAAGYKGSRCQDQEAACDNSSCANGSVCFEDETVAQRYRCNCTDTAFIGDTCSILKENKSCTDNLCLNEATCTDTQDGFNCSCAPGYSGPQCGLAINYCRGNSCQNGALCVNQPNQQNYSCVCLEGFTGDLCETDIQECNTTSPCSNGGTCVDGVASTSCLCPPGWEGENCQNDIDECNNSNTCQYGKCINRIPGYECNCSNTGYSGKNCSVEINECDKDFCVKETSLNCTNLQGSYSCDCMLGYDGMNCSEVNCSKGQCENNSTCSVEPAPWGTQWQCNCQTHYGGKQCKLAGPCASKPCTNTNNNTAHCEQDPSVFNTSDPSAGNFTCVCNLGWRGQTCSEDVNECLITDICHNGTCTNLEGGYKCDCFTGYSGENCTFDINECASNPCLHGGSCTHGIGFFTCDCSTTGYKGTTCSEDVDECTELTISPCNNGTCNNNNGSFTCDCAGTYLGEQCQYRNHCLSTVCGNKGTCNHTWVAETGDYKATCHCINGFTGERCLQSPQTDDDDGINIAVIIGPVIGVILLIIIIAVIIFIVVARDKRATRGAYSPSRQETAGARVELGNVLKKPPEERLI